ncbi:DNA-binding transcriptional regulator, XRE-family HTH domain [Alicyclobacillus macrosporangiidus]|uniref:DNA-binding transcriptional regulator, XRE-family HTH domain n=2 Tax=Alicyclobacillus macrosporangiidus TaxID=392015 RepID=A0A1I7FT68_9BACL|nr:DNA-binding transcriptional regulator, XRE-family HTH domain [Alicyclobacillus macrosporangiidus]
MMRTKLKQARKANGWTQAETAKRLGITERAYRHFEAGTRNPSYDTLVKLEQLFGMPHSELLVPDCTTDTETA